MLDKNIINIEYDEDKEVNRFEYKLFSEALSEIKSYGPYIRFTFQRLDDKLWTVRVMTSSCSFRCTYMVPIKSWPLIKVAKMGMMNIKGQMAETANTFSTYDFVIGDFLAGEYGSVANMINNNTEYAMDSDDTLNSDF